MTQMIKLNKKPAASEVDGRRGQVVKALTKLGAGREAVDLEKVKKSLAHTLNEKAVRAHVRGLRDDKVVTIKRVKAA